MNATDNIERIVIPHQIIIGFLIGPSVNEFKLQLFN
jgi:hypothetical protein